MNSNVDKIDRELLLAHVLQKSRAYVLAHPNVPLTVAQQQQFDVLLQRRAKGEPLAYIVGEKEFWSLPFMVTPAVLIPRPETECVVEFVLRYFQAATQLKLADIGTGSGVIAVALAHEKPNWEISASDCSAAALVVAKHNAKLNNCRNIEFFEGDLCEALPQQRYDLIVSNPPYIAQHDKHLAALQYEPEMALVAGEKGLAVLQRLIEQAPTYLNQEGLIVLEHGFDQASAVRALLQQQKFSAIQTHPDYAGCDRFTVAKSLFKIS